MTKLSNDKSASGSIYKKGARIDAEAFEILFANIVLGAVPAEIAQAADVSPHRTQENFFYVLEELRNDLNFWQVFCFTFSSPLFPTLPVETCDFFFRCMTADFNDVKSCIQGCPASLDTVLMEADPAMTLLIPRPDDVQEIILQRRMSETDIQKLLASPPANEQYLDRLSARRNCRTCRLPVSQDFQMLLGLFGAQDQAQLAIEAACGRSFLGQFASLFPRVFERNWQEVLFAALIAFTASRYGQFPLPADAIDRKTLPEEFWSVESDWAAELRREACQDILSHHIAQCLRIRRQEGHIGHTLGPEDWNVARSRLYEAVRAGIEDAKRPTAESYEDWKPSPIHQPKHRS